jgi:chromosome segregation ATPase
MNQPNEESQPNEFKNDTSFREVRSGSKLDKAFPSLWTLGLLISIIILLSLASGWKVVNLGLEKAKLERDIRANKAIRAELPGLETQKNKLRKEIDALKQSKELEELKNRNLKENNKNIQTNLSEMSSTLNNKESQLKEVEEKYAKLGSKIQIAKSDLDNLEPRLKLEQNFVRELEQKISTNQNKVSALEAETKGLELQKKNLQKEKDRILEGLNSLNEDRGRLQNLSEIFRGVADDMSTSRANIDNETKQLEIATKGIEAGKEDLLRAANSMSNKSKEIEAAVNQIEVIQKNFKTAQGDLNKSISESQEQIRSLKEIINNQSIHLEKNIKKSGDNINNFQASVKGVQNVTTKYEDELESLQKKIEIAEKTSNSMRSLEGSLIELKNKMSSRSDDFTNLFASADKQFETFGSNLDRALEDVKERHMRVEIEIDKAIGHNNEQNKIIEERHRGVNKNLKEIDEKTKENRSLIEKMTDQIKKLFNKNIN